MFVRDKMRAYEMNAWYIFTTARSSRLSNDKSVFIAFRITVLPVNRILMNTFSYPKYHFSFS
ncbi:MAG TPA: hypothetical protein VJ799_14685, partial [Nitrososphaeraceae archaeon]|nr:hypothetical protein [Nitrososphaeraceae archaeon]